MAILGSGSSGNAACVQAGGLTLLVEAGFSCRDLEARLTALGIHPARIDVLLLSHEHGDHARGAIGFARKHGTLVAGTRGTLRACRFHAEGIRVLTLEGGGTVDLNGFRVETSPVPHDAIEPVAFRIEAREGRIGFALDLGHAPRSLVSFLSGCEAVVLESNHDLGMLERGPYPRELKDRLRGPRGHLSNDEASQVISEVTGTGTRALVLAHVSRTNNRSDLALSAAAQALSPPARRAQVLVAEQERTSEWIQL